MLVLARRERETLVFPELDVVLEVLAIKGSTVRLGVQAPSTVRVLRGELAESRRKFSRMMDSGVKDPTGELMHRIRNWLHAANLRMQLIRRYLDADRVDAAAELIQKVLDDFKMIEGDQQRSSESRANLDVECFTETSNPSGEEKPRGLLVEDNANERQLLAGYLRTSGFHVEAVGDGVAALDYLTRQGAPDFVLLDMLMPHCDGPTVLRRIRGDQSLDRLKVFAVSGTSPANWSIPTGPAGVNRWFEKPVDPQLLVREISRELDMHVQAAKPR